MQQLALWLLLLCFLCSTCGAAGFKIPASSQCKQENEHFPCHKTYLFNYSVETIFMTPGSTNEEGIGKIDCQVQLDAEGECKYTLKVKSCSISEEPSIISRGYIQRVAAKSKEFSTAMERYVVGFTMSDGIVETLMAHTLEPPSILNFKRGIISSFITKKRIWKDDVKRSYSEMREDVQGICPVKYRQSMHYNETRSKLYMEKYTDKCHFPSRTNSLYSPSSLIWNTSVIHNRMIHFLSACEYSFNEAGILNTSECMDLYRLGGQSKDSLPFMAAITDISQKLTLSGQSDLKSENVYKTLTDYRPKKIQFEFETVEHQDGVIPDIKQKVHGLMDKLLTDPEKPINQYSAKTFDELVEILRHSETLNNVLDHCWISSTCTNDEYSDKEIQLGKIWKIALIQCNRVHCTKAFRSMLDWDPKYLQHAVTNNDLDWIFFAWANAKISDFNHIEAIIDIVEHKFSNRLSIGIVSSIIHNFRKSHTDEELHEHGNIEPKHRAILDNLVKLIKKPIGEGCKPSEGYKNIDVAAALHAYANVVPLYEFVSGQRLDLDQFQKCINGKEDHWPITISSLQATRFVRPTKELHTLLWKAFKDPSLRHEDHVIAYKILAEKFGGSDFLEQIVNFLEESEEKGVDYNMRTYIVTHLREVAKDRKPQRAEFSKAIRKAMVYKANLFRAIPDEKPIAKTDPGKHDFYEYRAGHVPWDIHVDDEEIFEEGLFSTYDEEHFNYGSSVFGGFGYGLAASTLFKKGSVFPYAMWVKEYVQMFDQNYNASQLAIFTKGLEEFFNVLSSQFSDDEDVVKSWAGITKAKAIFENVVAGTQHGSKLELPKFPYSVNEEVLKRLTALHKEKVKDIPETEESVDLIYQFGVFDNYLHQISLKEIPELVSKVLTNFNAKMNSPYKTNPLFWKVVEAETVIPTIIGIPLNWTTDAYWFSNSKLETKHSPKLNFDEEVVFNISGSFSALATLKLGMYLDLPGYTSYGAKSVSKISTSVGASVDFKLDIKDKKFKVQLELPQRPMDILSYKRDNYLVRHYEDVDIPDFYEKRQTEDSCSYTLSSLLGFKLCHNYSYVQLTEDVKHGTMRRCSSLAGNSHWSYTTDYISKHKVALQFGLHSEQVDGKTNIETYVKSRDPNNADKFNTILKWIHEVKKGQFKSQITAPVLPTFNILATREPLGDNGYHVKIRATVSPDDVANIDIQSQDTFEYVAESIMKSHLSNYPTSKQSLVPVTISTLNFTNMFSYYGYSYKRHEFPKTTYTDYKLQYKRLKAWYKSWPDSIFKHQYLWEEDGSAWLKFHREVKIDHQDEDDINQSYNVIKLPQSTLKLAIYNGPTTDNKLSFAFNLTHHYSPTKQLLNFLNFTSSVKQENKDGELLYVFKANTTMPLISLATKFAFTHEKKPFQETNITWIVRKEQLKHKTNFDKTELKWWAPNTDAFISEKTSARANFVIKEDSNPEWKKIKHRLRSEYAALLDAVSNEYYSHFAYYKSDQSEPKYEIDFQTKPTYFSMDEARYRRSFSVKSPTKKFDYDANLSLDLSYETEAVLWKSTLRLPNQEPAFYLFNITSPPRQGNIYVNEDLTSKHLKRNTRINVSYRKPVGNISIISQSPDEPLLNLELKAKYNAEGTTIKAKHHFVDIDFESSRLNGYTSKTDIKSKNAQVLLNMQWLVKYPNADEGVTLIFNFTDFAKSYHIISRSDWNATRLLIDICSQKNCTISDIDSDNFITEIELSLEDPQILTRTVTYNPNAFQNFVPILGVHISRSIQGFADYFADRSPANSIIMKLYEFTANVIKTMLKETSDFLRDCLLTLAENFIEAFYFAIEPIIWLVTYPKTVLRSQSTGYTWCMYYKQDEFVTSELEKRFLDGMYTPGPIPGKSYVVKTQLPVYWTQFNRLPLQLSPMFRRTIQEASEDLSIFDDAPISPFLDEEYERHALFTSSGDIYTFDGRVRHFKDHLRESCPYLLSHDYDEGKFSIYYHFSNMHFLFPELSVKLVPTGQIYVNETVQVDLPFSSWNGNIRMVRKENLTELTTTYGLKVVCSTNDFYCVFSTTDKKFNSLTGLLGNNNDNPLDEPKDVMHYELGESYMCRDSPIRKSYSADSSFQLRWFDLLWQPKSPTLACHDIVSPKDIFASAYISESFYVPCSLMNGYLALCGAKDVSVGNGPCFKCKSVYPWCQNWESRVESRIDVVFIIDLTYKKSSKNLVKGLETLANSFHDNLVMQHLYKSVSFGLVGYNGKGQWKEPQQHTMNGKLLGNYKEFTQFGLQTLTFDGPSNENLTAGISAVKFAVDHYNLEDTTTHVFVIITPTDSPIEKFSTKGLRYGHAVETLHVFSNYKEIADNQLFGLKIDGTAFSKDEGKFNFNAKPDKNPVSFPKGALAKIAGKAKGTVWQLRYLEDDEPQSKIFNNLFSLELLEQSKLEVNQCRNCYCTSSDTKQPHIFCEKATCKENPFENN